MGTDAQNPTSTPVPATTTPNFRDIPGHQHEPTMQAAPKNVLQSGPSGVAHAKGAGAEFGEIPDIVETANKLTEPIENYTPAGRAEHPILSRLGDVTRGVKELLEGGQAAGKPMGTSSSPIMDEANVLGGAADAAEYGAKGEELAREYAPKIAAHATETGRNFLTGLMEEGKAAFNAAHPEGSLEAGFAKIPGHRPEGSAPELPKQPKLPDTGTHAAIRTRNGNIYPDMNPEKQRTHVMLAKDLGIPAHEIESGGWLQDGTYEGSIRSDAGRYGEQARAQQRVERKRAELKLPEPTVHAGDTAEAEARMERARAGAAPDLEKNPSSIPLDAPRHTEIVNVDPNKFISAVNPASNTFDEPTVQKYQQAIRRGEEIKPTVLEYDENNQITGADGRHRAEASRRENVPLKVEVRRRLNPGEDAQADAEAAERVKAHEAANPTYELNGDEEAPKANEHTTEEANEGAYHPDLQKLADKYGTSDDAYKTAHGASFIAPDGKFIHLPAGGTHDAAIDWVGAGNGEKDPRPAFIKNTGVIRTRARFGSGGHELAISVPEQGVTHEQIDALKETARATLGSGKSGHIVMEVAKPDGLSAKAEFANANNIEPMLKEIGAHPDKAPVQTQPWNEKAAQLHQQNGGFTINPRTGAVPESGHVVEAVPEARQVSDKPNTPEQIQKFADKNKKLLAKNPELHVGGFTNDAGQHELNISAITNDSEKAEKVAKALDQESYYNAGEGKVVPTGGKNVQTQFPDYSVAQRLRDLAPEEPGMTISTRQPSSVKYSTEDPLRHNLRITDDLINKNPALAEKWTNLVKTYPGFQAPEGADNATVLNAFIDHAKDNLKHLYNSLPPEEQEKNKVWYDGAHALTKALANQHGYSHPQAAGVVAALSPQKDWDQNVSLARRLTDIVKNQQDSKATSEMLEKANEIREASKTAKNPNANKYLVSLSKNIKGKKLSQLTDPMERAAFVRLYDEVNNPREYFKINADGSNAGVYKKLDGTNGQVAWGSLNEIGKAIEILGDGSRESLSNNLGEAHKVRHFYNNIIEPNSARGDVTVDTHAVAAALMRPLSGKSGEVLANFGGPSSNIHGLNGTYPLYHEAYVRAAKELDIEHPRQLQSVVWEHIRDQFPAEFKTKENQDAINGIWKEAQNGQITADEARAKILNYAQEHRIGGDEAAQHSADTPELSGLGVHGESARGHGRGDRGVNPVGNKEERPSVKPAETSQKAEGGWLKMLKSNPRKNEFLK